MLELQRAVVEEVKAADSARTAEEIAAAVERPDEVETVFKILEHLAGSARFGIVMGPAERPDLVTFRSS